MYRHVAKAWQNRSSKMILGGVVAVTLTLLSVSACLDLYSSRNLRNIAKAQFNEEQLVIARHIASEIERELTFIRKQIEMVSAMVSTNANHIAAIRNQLEHPLYQLLGNGVYRTDIIDHAGGKKYSFGYLRKWRIADLSPDDTGPWDDFGNGKYLHISRPKHSPGGMRVTMAHLAPTRQHAITVELDVTRFLSYFLKNIRSGKTGYAWIIDDSGTFLYHPYTDFIGKSAFSAREERDPDLSHQAINFIQKNKMLAGEQGSGAFTAGWHRGITGKIEKLIGYCSIVISEAPHQQWSIAVVAPVSEIEGYIHKTYVWRFLFQAVIIVVIVFAGTVVLFTEIRWSRKLEQRVDERTEELKKSEEKYRSLVESAEDFIFTIDRQGRFQSMNSFTALFFGGRTEEFIGKDIDHVLPGESSRKHRDMLELVYKYERSVRDEFTLRAGDHEIWISANFMPIRDKAGHVESVLCIARDITNEKNLERQLINTEKLASLGTLAAGVAHEINNPLGVILGFSDYLIRKTPEDTQAYEDLKTIERQGMHCKHIVENLLRFARFGETLKNASDVNEAIREIMHIVAHTLEMEGIEMKTHLSEGIPEVRGDPRELQQVFLNLINNACQAMKGGGTLTIRSEYDRREKKAIMQIGDTGHGIGPENLDRIFEPFFTTKPEGEGTGLGLSVTYGIVSKYGGMIDCKSTPEGPPGTGRQHGTVFTIKMPILGMEN